MYFITLSYSHVLLLIEIDVLLSSNSIPLNLLLLLNNKYLLSTALSLEHTNIRDDIPKIKGNIIPCAAPKSKDITDIAGHFLSVH